MDNPITSPAHYTQGGTEPIQFIMSHNMSFLEGNIIKYVTRYKHKNGVEDLLKARQYLDWLIEQYPTKTAKPEGGVV